MSIPFGQWGGDNEERPFVTLDGVDYCLVPESIVEGAPLNPFSPSNADGNTTAVVSQRHASEVWDDFTAGVGYRDDEPGSHQYALGNLDARIPGSLTLPALAGNVGKGVALATPYAAGSLPVNAAFLSDDAGNYSFLTWRFQDLNSSFSFVRRITGNTVATVGVVDGEYFRGFAEWGSFWWVLTETTTGTYKLYKSSGAANAVTFAVVATVAATQLYGLVAFDNKLVTYNATTNTFQQFDGVSAFVAYVTGFQALPGSESVRQLFVWTDKSGGRDALYANTTRRLIVYDEDGQQWEDLYKFGDLGMTPWGLAHVNRRDNSLVLAPLINNLTSTFTANGNLLVFTPGTVDNIPINRKFAFTGNSFYGVGGGLAPSTSYPTMLASGIHWLYAFCFSQAGIGGDGGGVYAYNEFGGWTQVFDPAVVTASAAQLVGGGYGGGYLLTLLSDGSFYITNYPDMAMDHPVGTYDSRAAGSGHTYFLRSGRVFNKQRNIQKLGSHIEVTFKQPIPTGSLIGQGTVYLRWRFFNNDGLSTWQSSATFPAGAQRVSVNLTDGAGSNGIHYYYLEWELRMYMSINSDVPPVAESVVLYYTYFQTNHYAYSFNVDLSAETWKEYYPDGLFHGRSRAYLQNHLLALASTAAYHTFTYSQLFFIETVPRVDLSIARRESSDDASGIYSLTVRDLSVDSAEGVFYPG